jgi:[ribosomal protein S5]-alanine N-acetyltransferase
MTVNPMETGRLILRPFRLSDAGEVQRLAGAFEVADTTLNIPHPYEDGMAEEWIRSHKEKYENKQEIVFAIERRSDGQLLGAIGLLTSDPTRHAEMGYWIGKPFWNKGYATEAAAALLRYGFDALKLERIRARCFKRVIRLRPGCCGNWACSAKAPCAGTLSNGVRRRILRFMVCSGRNSGNPDERKLI